MECSGTESRLVDCRHSGIGVHNCGHLEDAGVSCPGTFGSNLNLQFYLICCAGTGTVFPTDFPTPGPVCLDFELRSSLGRTTVTQAGLVTYEGNIEICLGGVFFAVCDEGWDDQDAQVACSVLGYDSRLYRKF